MPSYYDNNKPTSANHREFILDTDIEAHFPSEGLYIGHLSGGNVDMPALVDINEVKGLCFFYNNEHDRSLVNHCIENLVWRVAATVPSQLCDLIIYNGGNAGDSFNTHTRINKYLFDNREEKVYFDAERDEYKLLINEVYSSVIDRMSTIRCAGKKNLVEYNESLGNEARIKYTFLFLTDFPRHLNTDMAEKLGQIIASGNKAGIYVMMTWDMQADFADANSSTAPFNPQSMLAGMEILFPQNGRYNFQGSGHDDILNQFNYEVDNYDMSGDEFKKLSDFIDLQVEIGKKKLKPSILKQDFETIQEADYEDTMSEISVTVGLDTMDKKPVTFRFNSGDYIHAFILGQSGSGKSVLLNNIITTAILKYSPQDLMLYLMDFKGVEFNRYRGVKHTKAVLVDNSDPQMTLEVLRELHEENKKRVNLWRKEGVNNIKEYNKKYPKSRLPQVLFVADECQVMFKESVQGSEIAIQREINEILDVIATQGRSQGIHMLLATQQLDGANISGKVLNNLTECFLLMSAPSDSERLVPDSSDKTSKQLTGIACYYHKKALQNQVQTFFATNEELEKAISNAQKKAKDMPGNGEFYCCGSSMLYIDKEEKDHILSIDSRYPFAAVGHNLGLEDKCTVIPLRKDFSENILFFGTNKEEQTSGVVMNALITLIETYKQQNIPCQFKVIDCLGATDARYQHVLYNLERDGLCEIIERTDSGKLLKQLANDISHREATPTILTIIGSERFAEMKRNTSLEEGSSSVIEADKGFDISTGVVNMDFFCDDNGDTSGYDEQIAAEQEKYSVSSSDEEESIVKTYPEALRYILDEGPMQDVHVLVQTDKPADILFESSSAYEIAALFRHKVILRSENKYLTSLQFSVDIDVEVLGEDEERLRAYYYPEDGGPQLFTPYLMPDKFIIHSS